MRISYWISYVCSSDLRDAARQFVKPFHVAGRQSAQVEYRQCAENLRVLHARLHFGGEQEISDHNCAVLMGGMERDGDEADRKRVVQGKRGAGREELGGRRRVKTKRKRWEAAAK